MLASVALHSLGHPRFVCHSRAIQAEVGPAARPMTFVQEEACEASLADVLAERPLALSHALVVLQEVAVALVDCHKAGVAHLNIKPSNIGFCAKWTEVRLRDFRCAAIRPAVLSEACARGHWRVGKRGRALGFDVESSQKRQRAASMDASAPAPLSCDEPPQAASGAGQDRPAGAEAASLAVSKHSAVIVSFVSGGAPEYLAPEVMRLRQGRCSSINAAKCDIWALGVLLFHCVFGAAPFVHSSLDHFHFEDAYKEEPARKAIMRGDPDAFWQVQAGRGLPVTGSSSLLVSLRSLVTALLAPNPADRPSAPMLSIHPWIGPAFPAAAVAAARAEFRARVPRLRALGSPAPPQLEASTSSPWA